MNRQELIKLHTKVANIEAKVNKLIGDKKSIERDISRIVKELKSTSATTEAFLRPSFLEVHPKVQKSAPAARKWGI